ncbi:MAG: M15 family metallopeptidase [Neomegalonema sp.]|nr:M15 family metallopeptidase [Neomegalonema sp.]
MAELAWRLWEKARAAALLLALLPTKTLAQPGDCDPVDFMRTPLDGVRGQDPIAAALELAYPGVTVDMAKNRVVIDGAAAMPLHDAVERTAEEALKSGSVRDQFRYRYPLEFDLDARRTPWNDPGRIRHQPFFLALYGPERRDVERSLTKVRAKKRRGPLFVFTKRRRVACQAAAALAAIERAGLLSHAAFKSIGGSYKWRVIAGTKRLSAHSYGISFDLNAKLGGYWRWAGQPAGRVGDYRNRIPKEIVEIFERYGFIWGGKWHHYDGMHFEYRPELILHSRLSGGF